MSVRGRHRHQRGVTLIELLIVLVITAILASAIGYAFTAELTMQRTEEKRRADLDKSDAMVHQITRLLQGAKLNVPVAAAPAAGLAGAGAVPSAAASPVTYFDAVMENGANDLGCDRLTFTTTAPALPMGAVYSTDDFETQQGARGPVGGLSEVSLGVNPVGDANGRTGLFERIERPSDSDPTQGGFESVLDSQVERIGFQFWDGEEWVSDWITTNPPRLPQAVRVSYTLRGQPSNDVHIFDVPLPASDISADAPQSAGAVQ
ncbi:MAG: prepilin-type N-terminal cleavage/methylation domain-containing protein [Janthinobacterium lividum]